MRRLKQFFQNYRLVRQYTSPLLKAAVFSAVALCTVTLLALGLSIQEKETELALLQEQTAALALENAELQARVDALGTAESYRQIAAEELGLVDPDTIVFVTD
ncbi:MAG: septum formation initiator family protein [Oscillospiraceae bacterium]|nr:septum formation initiator family protein [Oscillospiraceae bacterium]